MAVAEDTVSNQSTTDGLRVIGDPIGNPLGKNISSGQVPAHTSIVGERKAKVRAA